MRAELIYLAPLPTKGGDMKKARAKNEKGKLFYPGTVNLRVYAPDPDDPEEEVVVETGRLSNGLQVYPSDRQAYMQLRRRFGGAVTIANLEEWPQHLRAIVDLGVPIAQPKDEEGGGGVTPGPGGFAPLPGSGASGGGGTPPIAPPAPSGER